MNKNDTVILLKQGDIYEAYGSLSEIAKLKGVSRNTLYTKNFPFEYKGVLFRKIKSRTENGIVLK